MKWRGRWALLIVKWGMEVLFMWVINLPRFLTKENCGHSKTITLTPLLEELKRIDHRWDHPTVGNSNLILGRRRKKFLFSLQRFVSSATAKHSVETLQYATANVHRQSARFDRFSFSSIFKMFFKFSCKAATSWQNLSNYRCMTHALSIDIVVPTCRNWWLCSY